MSNLIAVAYDDRATAERVGGHVIQSSLSTEAEEKLQEALSASGAPA